MNRESCIQTIELLKQLALNIHGVIDVIDDRNCNDIINLLKEHKAVVRCKDCVYQYYDLKDGRIVCGNVDNGEIHPADWYCADGERKDE